MKKEIIISVLILLLIPTILAIDVSLSKTSYQPQETLQVEITGNFISLTSSNILVYKKDAVHSTPVISDLTKQGDVYYFYAILPNQQGNFSLKIEDSQYTESGQTKTDTITKGFIIEKTNQSALAINKGFIITSEDFSIKIKSLNDNQEVSAELDSTKEKKNVSLIQDSEKTLSFSILATESIKTNLKINDYNIPVFIVKKTQLSTNQTNQSETNQSEPPKIDIEDKTDEEIASLNCVDMGEKCEDNEKCNGEIVSSLDGSCCVGECKEKTQINYAWIIGVIILVIVATLVWFFYSKARKRQKPKSTEDILDEKSEDFDDRMKGSEVSGGLGRV